MKQSLLKSLNDVAWIQRGLTYTAGSALILIILGAFLAWPIGDTGHYVTYIRNANNDFHQVVQSIVPDSPAARAGLRVGDSIIQIDGLPVNSVVRRAEHTLVDSTLTHPSSVVVQRGDQVLTLSIARPEPTATMQVEKAAFTLLALLCWITGYYLGVIRHQHRRGTPFLAIFWMAVGCVIGTWTIAQDYLIPTLVLVWLLSLNLVPMLVCVHLHYPPRLVTMYDQTRKDRNFILLLLAINGVGVIGSLLRHVPIVVLIDELLLLFTVLFSIALVLSVGLLIISYRHASRIHTQRQIRLIFAACSIILLCRLLVRAVPPITAVLPWLDGVWLDLLFGLIPLAYLIGDGWHDLYRIDRVSFQLLIHLATITGLSIAFSWILESVHLYTIVGGLFASIAFVVVYRPTYTLFQRFLPGVQADRAREFATESTLDGLTRSLDPVALSNTLVDGVQRAVGTSAIAFYRWDVDDPNTLRLHVNRMADDVPQVLPPALVTTLFGFSSVLVEQHQLTNGLAGQVCSEDEKALLLNTRIALWGSIRHQGELLGVLLLGERDTFDSYHAVEIRTLHRLLSAASLAFANSSLHMQQQQAESLVRQLYRRLQVAQDEAARDLARELHDEVINGQVGLNLETLERVLAGVEEPYLRGELERIIEGENTVIGTLRQIGEQLYPTGIDDPLGLSAVVRSAVIQYQGRIAGGCRFNVIGDVIPVPSDVQYEVLRVTREALTNVVKHARSNAVVVELKYQTIPREKIYIRIQDRGNSVPIVAPRSGHLGVRTMQESARSVGGTLQFLSTPGGGTTVEFSIVLEQRALIKDDISSKPHIAASERLRQQGRAGSSFEPATQL
jgi:signal transduction histidine kinase